MTPSESDINEILAVLDEGGGTDLVHQLAQFGIQELIEAGATEAIGAAAWERSPDRASTFGFSPSRVWSTSGEALVDERELGIGLAATGLPQRDRTRHPSHGRTTLTTCPPAFCEPSECPRQRPLGATTAGVHSIEREVEVIAYLRLRNGPADC
jgi:hypothetical protein